MRSISLMDAIARVNKDDAEEADIDAFCNLFGIYELSWDEEFNKRVKLYYIETWICTDTRVGTGLVYFDGVPVAIHQKLARKSHVDLILLNLKVAEQLRTFMTSLYVQRGESLQAAPEEFVIPLRGDGELRLLREEKR